jgi:hypothetical protein
MKSNKVVSQIKKNVLWIERDISLNRLPPLLAKPIPPLPPLDTNVQYGLSVAWSSWQYTSPKLNFLDTVKGAKVFEVKDGIKWK